MPRKACVLAASILLLGTWSLAMAATGIHVQYENEKLSLQAEQAPLFSVLQTIKQETGMQVYLSDDISSQNVTISFRHLSLRQGLMRILRHYSYALVYTKHGTAWVPARLEIYPRGKRGGNLRPLGPKSGSKPLMADADIKTVLVESGQEVVIHNSIQKEGLLAPARTTFRTPAQAQKAVDQPWFVVQQDAESREAAQHRELRLLRRRIEATKDPAKKDALSAAYASRMQKFYEQKRAAQNKVEAMKRLQEYRELTRRQQARNE